MKSTHRESGSTITTSEGTISGSSSRVDYSRVDSMSVFNQVVNSPKGKNPLSYYSQRYRYWEGSEHIYNVNGPHIYQRASGIMSQSPTIDFVEWLPAPGVYNNTLADLVEQIRQNDFNLPVALGQLKETAALGKDLFSLTKKFVKQLPPAKLLVTGSALLAEARLAYSYAVKPTVSDIIALVDLQPRDTYAYRIKAKSQQKDEVRLNGRAPHTKNLASYRGHQVIGCKIVCDVSIKNPVVDLSERVNAWNPLLLGWELVPFSFIIDGFVDIGTTLDLLGAALTLNQNLELKGTVSRYSRRQVEGAVSHDAFDWPYVIKGFSNCSIKEVSVDRSVIYSLPFPERPSLSIPTGSGFLLNCAALLRSVGLGKYH